MICRGIQIQEKQYIGENSVPKRNRQYIILLKDGKYYSPKYVIADVNHLVNGINIMTEGTMEDKSLGRQFQ